MTTSTKAARNSRFQKGSAMYACRCCKRNTRSTGNGDNENVLLCVDCVDLAGEENSVSDSGEFYASPAEVLGMIASVVSHGGDASCWDELKAKAEALANPAPAAEPVEVLHPEYAAAIAIARAEIDGPRGVTPEPTANGERLALVQRFGDLSVEIHALQARLAALSAERDGIVAELLQPV
jgi:hypothetical protein